ADHVGLHGRRLREQTLRAARAVAIFGALVAFGAVREQNDGVRVSRFEQRPFTDERGERLSGARFGVVTVAQVFELTVAVELLAVRAALVDRAVEESLDGARRSVGDRGHDAAHGAAAREARRIGGEPDADLVSPLRRKTVDGTLRDIPARIA